jgi:hypothetical protein
MKNIHIETLYDKLKGILSDNFMGVMVECCALRLTLQGHASPVDLKPFKEDRNLLIESLKLGWITEITPNIVSSYRDENRITDYAAMCIAFIFSTEFIDFDYVEMAEKGDGVDCWLRRKDAVDFIARLEISGIRKANAMNSIQNRLKIKLKQTNQSDASNVPAYISIIEFSQPEILYLLK